MAVGAGHARSESDLLEHAVAGFLGGLQGDEADLASIIARGEADYAAVRYKTVATKQEAEALLVSMKVQVRCDRPQSAK